MKDVLLAGTYEFGEGDTEAYLLGPGFDLAIPGFDYFQLNFYYRKPDGNRVRAGAWQITPVWSYTIPVGNSDILIDGYMDWVINNKSASTSRRNQSDYHANLHFNPQVKYDLGKALGYEPKHLYVGLEYDYWSDKYGVKDSQYFTTDQNTPQASWSSTTSESVARGFRPGPASAPRHCAPCIGTVRDGRLRRPCVCLPLFARPTPGAPCSLSGRNKLITWTAFCRSRASSSCPRSAT